MDRIHKMIFGPCSNNVSPYLVYPCKIIVRVNLRKSASSADEGIIVVAMPLCALCGERLFV